MNTPQNPQTPHSGAEGGPQRKAFIFYSNWYTDARRGLTDRQLAEFVLVIIRYASEGILPDDTTSPVVRTMFGLIQFTIDADLKKYEDMVETNRARAETSAEKRRSVIKRITSERLAGADVEVADYEQSQCLEPRNKNQETKNNKEKKEEEALARREDVETFWREHHYRSDMDEFLDYYTCRHWMTARGVAVRSWKRAAVMWEDKFRRDVLPQRRREERAQAALEAERRTARHDTDAATERRSAQAQREADLERAARRSVSPELGKHMYRRALLLANDDDRAAMDLMRQAPDNPEVFKRLAEGYTAS